MMMNKYLIYGLIDPITNELRYIGRSSSGLQRPRCHFTPCILKKEKNHCHNWIKSLINKNLKPEIIIIETFDNSNNLNEAEIYWIAYFKFLGCNLTNLTDGGQVVYKEINLKSRKPFYEVYSGKRFNTLKQAAQEFKIDIGFISRVLNRKLSHAKGYVFRYINEKFEYNLSKEEFIQLCQKNRAIKRQKKIKELTTNKSFRCMEEASIYFNIHISSIISVLKNHKTSCKDLIFIYE